MPAIVFILLYTEEMEPRLFYDSHNHHPWLLHRDISSNRLLRGTPRCQIKVSGWRSVREQRGSVCVERAPTNLSPLGRVHAPPLACLFKHCTQHGGCCGARPHTLSLTAGPIVVNLCRTTQLITTVGRASGSAWQMRVGSARWEPERKRCI